MQTWVAAGGEAFENRGSDANLRPAYPPSTLAIVAPFALFRWLWARDLFLISVVALFPILLRAVMRLGQTRWNTDTGLAGSAFAFALAPWHAAIAWQSITAPALELAIIGASIRSNFGSVLTGLALCLKPQLAAWFLLFEIVKKRWHRVSVALVIFAFVTLFAVTRMPVGWLSSYRENLRYFFAIGDVNDFTLRNASRFELLNLQVIYYFVTRRYAFANILAWFTTAVLVLFWLRKGFRSEAVCVAVIALIGLLPVYQRIYNAGVIVLILPYALRCWAELRGKLLLALCSVFLLPGVAILQTLHTRRWLSDAFWNQSWWFNVVVGPHCTWALLGIIAILLLSQESTVGAEQTD